MSANPEVGITVAGTSSFPFIIVVDKFLCIPENQFIHESAILNAVAEPVPVTGTPRPLWGMTL